MPPLLLRLSTIGSAANPGLILGLALGLFVGVAIWGVWVWKRFRHAAPPDDAPVQNPPVEGRAAERFRELFEQAGEALLYLSPAHLVVEANPAAARLFGSERLHGLPFEELFGPSGAERAAAARALSESLVRDTEVELEVQTRPAGRRSLFLRARRLRESSSVGRGLRVSIRDVTEARRIEERVRQAQKVEAVGRLAAGISHEFNNLLSVLIGHAELLDAELDDRPRARESVRIILEQARRAKTLTSQIQGFSRSPTPRPVDLELDAAIGELLPLLRAVLGEKVRLESELAAKRATVRADPTQLEQILINLVLNARDSEGVHTIRVATRARGGRVLLEVTDDGEGIDPGTRQRIFEPFFTTKPPGKGTGLGLSIVREMAIRLGGRVEVESRVGEGATFRVVLPSRVPLLPPVLPAPRGSGPASTGRPAKARILVVEDEKALGVLLEHVLQEAGHDVELVGSASEALARSGEGPWDLLLVDIGLPDTSGTELVERWRRQDPDIRVILMTGYAGGAQVAGPDPVLSKPFAFNELLAQVAMALPRVAEGVGRSG